MSHQGLSGTSVYRTSYTITVTLFFTRCSRVLICAEPVYTIISQRQYTPPGVARGFKAGRSRGVHRKPRPNDVYVSPSRYCPLQHSCHSNLRHGLDTALNLGGPSSDSLRFLVLLDHTLFSTPKHPLAPSHPPSPPPTGLSTAPPRGCTAGISRASPRVFRRAHACFS